MFHGDVVDVLQVHRHNNAPDKSDVPMADASNTHGFATVTMIAPIGRTK